MHVWSRAWLAIVVLALAGALVAGTVSTSATAPAPVLEIERDGSAGQGDGGEPPTDEETPEEQPSEEETAPGPAEGCLIGPSAGLGRLTSYPGPVVAVEPEQATSDCLTRLSLSLIIQSESGRDPEGADAALDGQVIPRAQLESGFSTTLPSTTRVITLTDPGDEWEVMEVACTCGGGLAAAAGSNLAGGQGRLTSHPGPVIGLSDPTAQPGSTDCPAGTTVGGTLATTPSSALSATRARATRWAPAADASSVLTVQPAPVVAVTPAPAPEPPPRRPGRVAWHGDGTIRITDYDAAGGAFGCVWVVEHVYGQLRIRTLTEPSGLEDRISYRVTSSMLIVQASGRTMPGSSSGSQEQLWKGPWQAELVPPSDAWEFQESTCADGVTTRPSAAGGSIATIGVDPGDTVECTFRVKLLAPRPGRWQANNGRGLVACGPVSFRLDPVTRAGRLEVRRDGDRLIVRGLAQGATSATTLDRDPDDPRLYRGRLPISVRGISGSFDVTLRLMNEERMEGDLSGTVRFQGERCDLGRPLTLTYGS